MYRCWIYPPVVESKWIRVWLVFFPHIFKWGPYILHKFLLLLVLASHGPAPGPDFSGSRYFYGHSIRYGSVPGTDFPGARSLLLWSLHRSRLRSRDSVLRTSLLYWEGWIVGSKYVFRNAICLTSRTSMCRTSCKCDMCVPLSCLFWFYFLRAYELESDFFVM